METQTMTTGPGEIPKIVRDMLQRKWREYADTFECIFRPNGKLDADRILEPPYYYHSGSAYLCDVFTQQEALAFSLFLKDTGRRVHERTDQKNVCINEHVQHAFSDFMAETYQAWRKFNERLDEIENLTPSRFPLAAIPNEKAKLTQPATA